MVKKLKALAERAVKEVAYHRKWSSEWVIRLGDGTEESHQKVQEAVDNLWSYTGEMFQPAAYETEAHEHFQDGMVATSACNTADGHH